MKKIIVLAIIIIASSLTSFAQSEKAKALRQSAKPFTDNFSQTVINPVEAKIELAKNAEMKERKVSPFVDQEVSIDSEGNKSILSHEITGWNIYAGGGVLVSETINPLGKIGFGYDFSPRFSAGLNFAYSNGKLGTNYEYKGYNLDGDVMVKLLSAKAPVQFAIGAQAGFLRNLHSQSSNVTVIQDGQTIVDEDINSYYDGYNFKFGPKATFEVKASNKVSSKLYDLRIGLFAQYDMFSIKHGQTNSSVNQSANAISAGIYLKWNIGRKIF